MKSQHNRIELLTRPGDEVVVHVEEPQADEEEHHVHPVAQSNRLLDGLANGSHRRLLVADFDQVLRLKCTRGQ